MHFVQWYMLYCVHKMVNIFLGRYAYAYKIIEIIKIFKINVRAAPFLVIF